MQLYTVLQGDSIASAELQNCLDAICEWSNEWQLKLAPAKCIVMRIPSGHSFADSLAVCNLERLDTRREQMVRDLFIEIKEPGHVLHNLLPYKRFTAVATRDHYSYELPLTKTFRYSRSFIPHCIRKRY
jgi:hypothetical protein